jgi:hypothetical protein
LIRPAILVIRILVMLTAVAGGPPIHTVAPLAMLVAIIFIPTLLTAHVYPMIGVRASRLNRIGRLGDANRVRAGCQIVEAIRSPAIGQVGGDGGALAVLEGNLNVGPSGINARGQKSVTIAIQKDHAANTGLRSTHKDALRATVAVAAFVHRRPRSLDHVIANTKPGCNHIRIAQEWSGRTLVDHRGITGNRRRNVGDSRWDQVALAPGTGHTAFE